MGRLIIMLISDFCRVFLGEGTLTTDEKCGNNLRAGRSEMEACRY